MDIANKIKEVFGDLEHLTPERIKEVIQGLLESFRGLKNEIDSTDPKIRAEGLRKAQELKTVLEAQMESLAKSAFLDPTKLMSLMQGAAPVAEKDKEVLKEIRKDLNEYRKEIFPEQASREVLAKPIKLTV